MSTMKTWVACLGVLAIAATAAAFSPHSAMSLRSMLRPAAMSIRRRGFVSTTMQARDKLTGEKFEETDEAKNPGKRPGHAVAGSAANVNVSPEVKIAQERVQAHQAGCPKLSWAEEVRTIMAQKSGFATISTMSNKHQGFPLGSIVGFAVDSQGRPYFSFSALSSHTQNLLSNPKASLCVTEPKFKGAADARVTLIGSVNLVDGEESDALRKEYMVSHPGAYWAEFGDFKIYRMDKIEDVSFVGGFARAGGVTVEEYMSSEPDPLMAFADPVMNHMNEDHTDSLKEYVTYLVGVEGGVDSAQMKRLDKYGFDIRVAKGSDSGILRIPFPSAVVERKGVKEAIVALSQQVAQKKKEAGVD